MYARVSDASRAGRRDELKPQRACERRLFIHIQVVCLSLIAEPAAEKPKTTMTARTGGLKPKPTIKLTGIIIKKTLTIYHKIVRQTARHMGIVIFTGIFFGIGSLVIMVCLCR